MKRELLKLIGGVPRIVYTDTKKSNRDRIQKWVWSPFHNPARNDNYRLTHWQRKEDVEKDYEFAQFNKKIDIIEFSQDEYNMHIKPSDSSWTYEETLYLWDLLKRFDLRFTVVHDRYDDITYQERTIEELKDRYYSICRKILENRKIYDHPIIKSGYNYEQEIKRRNYLERTMNCVNTDENKEKEEMLIKQSEVIERKLERFHKIEDTLQNMVITINDDDKDVLTLSKNDNISFEEYLKQNASVNDSFVYLRSAKMKHNLPVSEKIQMKVDSFMKELNITQKLIPTVKVEQTYDMLRNNIVLYTSLSKYLEKKEKESVLLQCKLKEMQSKKTMNGNNNVNGSVVQGNVNGSANGFGHEGAGGNNRGSVEEKKKKQSGTPVKPRKRKNNNVNDNEDSVETGSVASKKRKKGQK